jgi:hypothetical protein
MPIKKAARATISKAVRSRLAAFYEGDSTARLKCVVTESDREVELHHLDENPAHSSIPQNFIPLKSSLNKNLDKRQSRLLDERISRDGLATKSAFYYSRGRYAYGYGCSILGATLAANIPWGARHPDQYFVDADSALFFAANALINLRPLDRVDYATYVLHNHVCPIIRAYGAEVERPTLARLAMEIGSYFRDAGDYKRALELSGLARRLLDAQPRSARVKVLNARLWQHDGISSIIQGDLTASEECFKRAATDITIGYSVGHANQTLYEAQILLRRESPPFDQIMTMVKRYPSGSDPQLLTAWTDLELRLTEAQAEYQKSDPRAKARAFARVEQALKRLKREGVVPTRAIFAPVLLGFADEYPSYRTDVQVLLRTLSEEFVSAANVIQSDLQKLGHTDHRVA